MRKFWARHHALRFLSELLGMVAVILLVLPWLLEFGTMYARWVVSLFE
jgi:hypothetical protein